MKKSKRHQFSHPDPEQKTTIKKSVTATETDVPEVKDNVPAFVYRDLKRTAIIIGSFIVMVVLLYGIQVKTSWFSPILKKFGL